MNEFAGTSLQEDDAPGVLFVRAVVRSSRWVLAVILLGGALGIAAGVLQPNRYDSNAKLFLRTGAREQFTSESLVEVDARQPAPAPTMTMADEMQLVSDVAIFERVARELGPRVLSQPADPARDDGPLTSLPIRVFHRVQGWIFRSMDELGADSREDDLRAATKTLRRNTTVSNERGSNVILVSYTAGSPETAQAIVGALTRAFIERHRDQFSIRSLLENSRSQLEDAKLARDEAAKACIDRVSQSEISMLELQLPHLETELTSIQNDLFVARLRRDEIRQSREGVTAATEIRPSEGLPKEARETPTAKPEPKFRVTPPTAARAAGGRDDFAPSSIEGRSAGLDAEDEALRVKIGLLESQLDMKKSRLDEFQTQLLAATTMRKDLMATRDAQDSRYAHMLARLTVLQALENIDGDEGANLCVLQAPTLEAEAVGPKRLLLLLKGLLIGTVAAAVLVLLRQTFESRLCDPETFERAQGVPVIGVIPHLPSLRLPAQRATIGKR